MHKLQLFIVLIGAALLNIAAEDEAKKLNPSDFFEPCATPFVTKNQKTSNIRWASGAGYEENSLLYFPFWNKAMAYYTLQRMYNTQEFDDIKESHLTNNCVTHNVTGDSAVLFGQGDRNFSSTWIPVPNAPGRWYWPPHFPGATPANVYRSFTDNKSYSLFTVCWENGMGTYMVSSTEKTLPPETLNTIKEVVLALGFKEDFFLESNYDVDCETLEDLPVPKNITTPPTVPTIPNFMVPNLLFLPQNYPPQRPQQPSLYRLSYSWRK